MLPEVNLPDNFKLYLARHATPDRSRIDIPYHVPPGPELTDKGRQEAAELGCFFNSAGVKHILASPLARTWSTATIASEISGASLEINHDLAEWRPEEVERKVLERMQRAFVTSLELIQHGPVALVTHGSPIMILLKWLGLPADMIERHRIYDSRNLIPMAGVWQVEKSDGVLNKQLVFAPEGVRLPEGTTM